MIVIYRWWSWSGWYHSNIHQVMTIMAISLKIMTADHKYGITFDLFITNKPEKNGCTSQIPYDLSLLIWMIKTHVVFICLCFSHFQNVLISLDQNVQSRPENNGCTCYNLNHMMLVIWISKTRFSFKGLGFLTFWEPSPCTAREIYSCTGALLEKYTRAQIFGSSQLGQLPKTSVHWCYFSEQSQWTMSMR